MRLVAHHRVSEGDGHHGLGHRHTADADTGVMAPFGDNLNIIAVQIDRTPWSQD